MKCNMCEASIRGGSPIAVYTASLFSEKGRWTEHITVDNCCSLACLQELHEFDSEDCSSAQASKGGICNRCQQRFSAGYTLMLGWAKNKSQKRGWHQSRNQLQFCSQGCVAQELADSQSCFNVPLPRRKPKNGKI